MRRGGYGQEEMGEQQRLICIRRHDPHSPKFPPLAPIPGLIIPGFLPTPLGEIVEYVPTLNETMICLGIWAFGILLFSWMLKLAAPIMSGRFQQGES